MSVKIIIQLVISIGSLVVLEAMVVRISENRELLPFPGADTTVTVYRENCEMDCQFRCSKEHNTIGCTYYDNGTCTVVTGGKAFLKSKYKAISYTKRGMTFLLHLPFVYSFLINYVVWQIYL